MILVTIASWVGGEPKLPTINFVPFTLLLLPPLVPSAWLSLPRHRSHRKGVPGPSQRSLCPHIAYGPCGLEAKVGSGHKRCLKILSGTLQGTNILLMAEILHHLLSMKPYKKWNILHINWCRIFSINSIITMGKGESSTQTYLGWGYVVPRSVHL